MKAALITEEQIKAIESALKFWCVPLKSTQLHEALAIVKSLKVQEPIAIIDDDGFAWGYGIEGGKLPSGTKVYAREQP